MAECHIVAADRIAHILNVYTHVEWPLDIESVDQIIHELGWTRIPHTSRIKVVTDFPTNDTSTSFLKENGVVKEIDCYVSDSLFGEPDLSPVKEAYKSVWAVVSSVLGKRGGGRSGDSWWDLPTGGRVHVKNLSTVVALDLLSREYADIERGEARYGISPNRVLGQDE